MQIQVEFYGARRMTLMPGSENKILALKSKTEKETGIETLVL